MVSSRAGADLLRGERPGLCLATIPPPFETLRPPLSQAFTQTVVQGTKRRPIELVGISQSTISAVLNGTRSLTKSHVETLSEHFSLELSSLESDRSKHLARSNDDDEPYETLLRMDRNLSKSRNPNVS